MSEDTGGNESTGRGSEGAGPRSARFSDGIRQGIGVLSAFKDALEETIQEARERGDLSTERAKEVMKEALEKAQSAAGEARERLDFAQQGDLDALRSTMDSIVERVAALEEHVFGAARPPADAGTAGASGSAEDATGGDGNAKTSPEAPAGDT